jgi:colanic acid/amylovoran biosynthesis glycosyltransferase
MGQASVSPNELRQALKMKIAYLVSQYPKVSHSFIRREILALEALDFNILRISIRGWDQTLVDPVDQQERTRTKYVLAGGLLKSVAACGRMLMRRPAKFAAALRLALKSSVRSDRPLPYHLIYLAEACLVAEWLEEFGAQHLHAHFGTNGAQVAMLAHILGGPDYSFTVHGPEEFDKPEFLGLREKIQHSAFVVAITSFCRSQLYRWANHEDWDKIAIVHCGIEQAFHQSAAVPLPSVPQLVCVGRLCEQKGQLLLVRAVERLVRAGQSISLVLAGDGEMRPAIEQLIDELKLSNHVRITGWISSNQVRDEIVASLALVLPSFAEGLPVVVMEAMSLYRPVLTTYIAGIPELVIDKENGWLIPAGDIDALVVALQEILEAPDALLQAMGTAAHQRVVERHSIDIEAKKLAVLFRDTLHRQPVLPASAISDLQASK